MMERLLLPQILFLLLVVLHAVPSAGDEEDDRDVEHFDAFGELLMRGQACTKHTACGAGGACCRIGESRNDPACAFGQSGCEEEPCCVLTSESLDTTGLDNANQGEACFEEHGLCSFFTGLCEEQCGSAGACCMKGKSEAKACGGGQLGCLTKHCELRVCVLWTTTCFKRDIFF